MGREAQGPEDEGMGGHLGQSREEAPVLLLPAGGRDGPLRCDWEEAKSERGQREPGAYWGPRRGGCELAAAEPARGHLRDRLQG